MSYSLNQLYGVIGISKQAVSQYDRRQRVLDQQAIELVASAEQIRKEQPGCGVEKMYDKLKPSFIGRDRFIELMMETGFRLRRPRNGRRTTYSADRWYPNLIKGMRVRGASQVWQSDITYIEVNGRFYYAVFIIDVYTKKIVGYEVSRTMRATANVRALAMALARYKAPAIHHSDRGSQYISKEYCQLLKSNQVRISMAVKAPDNAYAERINLTIKEEYLHHWQPQSFDQLKRQMKKAVNNYNNERLHNSLGRISPHDFENKLKLSNFKKPTIIIFDDTTFQKPVNLF